MTRIVSLRRLKQRRPGGGLSMRRRDQGGFTIVEAIIGCVVFGIIAGVMLNSYEGLRASYVTARQLNEIYTVLSACPEVDRALEFTSLSSTSNCYPNNSFPAEDGGSGTITYTPSLSVTNTSALGNTDPLYGIPDSKVVKIDVGYPRPNTSAPHLQLRMLITRNGVGQL
ncbi:MAG TPA: type II secretion system protein [Candidatus Saccharimonadales bacterium]|nr:type II secretion system protein [Candidatus Saccharimonadales bacterium]